MKIKCFRILSIVFLIGWMILIFFLSAQNASESSETSGGFIKMIVKFFYPHFRELGQSKQDAVINSFQFVARKAAHFSIYAILGFLSFASIISYRNLFMKVRVIIASVVCLLYAVSDELHQLFVVGRSCEVRDVCIDFCGSMIAIGLCLLLTYKIKRINYSVRWMGNGEQK